MNTPPFGTPIWARNLQVELREHTDEDRRKFDSLQQGQAELQVETGKQTVMLVEIQRDLGERRHLDHTRSTTEIELAAKTKGWWRKGAIGTLFAAIGAALGWLAHHFL
jgi:hypothetical protein